MEQTFALTRILGIITEKHFCVFRAPERYRDAHIPGALNIPPEKIKELAPQLLPTKNVEIITYCANTH